MRLSFYKAQATGNDFVVVDNRTLGFRPSPELVRALCDRRFGIGADGLILLELSPDADYRMVYFNSDGPEGSMCGNGARAAYQVMHYLCDLPNHVRFQAIDGMHTGGMLPDGRIRVQLLVQPTVQKLDAETYFADTGSPHVVRFVADVATTDVRTEGARLRHDLRFAPGGTNVNFVARQPDHLAVRTFERGVEAETLSCGTGVTAAALVAAHERGNGQSASAAFTTSVHTPGGALDVERTSTGEVYLIGPAAISFSGQVDVDALLAQQLHTSLA